MPPHPKLKFPCAVPITRNQVSYHVLDKQIYYHEYMVDHLKNLLRGASGVLDIAPDPRPYKVDPRGFETDANRLRGDFATVGSGLSKQLKQLKRESANNRTR